jgi:hypothetical protein
MGHDHVDSAAAYIHLAPAHVRAVDVDVVGAIQTYLLAERPETDATALFTLIDTLAELRCPGQPLPHPRHGRPVQFLLTRHGRRVSASWLRGELHRAAAASGLDPVTTSAAPHLRHRHGQRRRAPASSATSRPP